MTLDYQKNVKRNAAAYAVSNATKLAFPFLNRTLFLWILGPEYLGLNGLFASILGVLSLVEFGFAKAVVSSLHKPVADDDLALVRSHLLFFRTVYRWVGLAVMCIGLCLLPILPRLVHGDVPCGIDIRLLYLIHLANVVLSYLFFAYRSIVLFVHHRQDVYTNIHTATSVLQYLATFAILFATRNYYHYVLATVFFTALQNFAVYKASNRLFPDIWPEGRLPKANRDRVISDVKAIFLHRIGEVMLRWSDNLVVSSLLGLVSVAAYGNYMYVAEAARNVAGTVGDAMAGGFGNKIHTLSKKEAFQVFMRANQVSAMSTIWCTAMMVALCQPFIEVWTRGNPIFVRHALTPVLAAVYAYIAQMRLPLLNYKAAAGKWRQDRFKPLMSASVNLVLSASFAIFLPDGFKLDGVIAGSIISIVAVDIPWESRIVFRECFDPGAGRIYWRRQFSLSAKALATCIAAAAAAIAIRTGGIPGFALKSCVVAAAATAASLALFKDNLHLAERLRLKSQRRNA